MPSATCVVRVGVGVVVFAAEVVVCVLVCDSTTDVVGARTVVVGVVGCDAVAPGVDVDVELVLEVDVTVVVVVDDDELDVGNVFVVVVVVIVDVAGLAVVVVVVTAVVAEQPRKFPLSLPFDPFPWLSSQFPCPPPLCTHGSPP